MTTQTSQKWNEVLLKDAATFKTGKLNSNAATKNGEYPFFTCSQEVYKTDTFSFDTECVLLGGNNANAIYPIFYFNGKFDAYQRTYIIESKDNYVRFLYYLLTEKLNELRLKSTGSATKFLTLKILHQISIDLPDLSTQKQIADILSAYDDLIKNNSRRIKILEEVAQRIYTEWFVDFCFPGYEKIKMNESGTKFGKIPQDWEVKNLGDIADIKWGDTSTTKQSYISDGYDAYSASGLDGKLNHFDYTQDGIVLSAIGANCGLTWLAKGKWSCIKNTIRILEKDPEVDIEYLYLLTSRPNYWKRRGAAQPFISQTEANTYTVLKPTATILKSFNSFVRPLYNEIYFLEKENANLLSIRNILIPKLVTGKLEIKP